MDDEDEEDRIMRLRHLAAAARFAVIADTGMVHIVNNRFMPRPADAALTVFGLIGYFNHLAASRATQ